MIKLLLQEHNFPEKFNKIDVSPPKGMAKLNFIEEKILEALNTKNPRLNLSEVEYLDVKSEFPDFIGGKFSAVIVEEEVLRNNNRIPNDESRYYTNSNEELVRQKIISYVFTSPATKNEGRNITVTQDIFPEFMDYLEKYIDSPSYTYANHPFYYISLMSPTPGNLQPSILENYTRLNLLEVNFVELFSSQVSFNNLPNDVCGMLNFMVELPNTRKNLNSIMSTDDYKFDLVNKTFTIFAKSLSVDLKNNDFGSRVKRAKGGIGADFNGSEEKFYWLDVLSMFELALKNNYEIDYSELWDFYNKNYKINSFRSSKKFLRFKSLLDYFDKKNLKL